MEDKIARIFTPPPKFRFKILKGENLGGESLRSDFKNVATSVLLESLWSIPKMDWNFMKH